MAVVLVMPNGLQASAVHPAELHGKRAVGSRWPARIGCWTRPLPLEGCVTCGHSPVRTHCRRGDPLHTVPVLQGSTRKYFRPIGTLAMAPQEVEKTLCTFMRHKQHTLFV